MSKQNQDQTLSKLTKLIKGLSAKSDLARFRNDYRDIVRQFPEDVRAVLNKARDAVEAWIDYPPLEAAVPAEQAAVAADETAAAVEQKVVSVEKAEAAVTQVKIPTKKAKPTAKKVESLADQVPDAAKQVASAADETEAAAEQAKAISEQEKAAIEKARAAVEQWQGLFREGTRRIPVSFFAALLRKLPSAGVPPEVWKSFLATCRSEEIVEGILAVGHVTKKKMTDWLMRDLRGFYSSALLDVAVKSRSIKSNIKVWREVADLGERPSGLIPHPSLLVRIYDRWHAPEADAKLLSYLSDASAADRHKVFGALLHQPAAMTRWSKVVAKNTSQNKDADTPEDSLLANFLHFLTAAQRSDDVTEATIASVSLGLLRLYPASQRGIDNTFLQSTFELQSREAAVETGLAIAHRLEENAGGFQAALFVVLRGGELQKVIREHIKRLSSLTASGTGDSEPIESQSQYHHHAGQRELLQKITSLLATGASSNDLREELEVLLFNAGVRPMGAVGKHSRFDTRLHRSSTAGTMPGEEVEILKEGYQIGTGDEVIILAKALVRALDE